jgi:hypothetical protein
MRGHSILSVVHGPLSHHVSLCSNNFHGCSQWSAHGLGLLVECAVSPMTAAAVPELSTAIAQLRDVLGDQTYESLARRGETMTTAAIATYAYDQIDQARTQLKAVSK